MDDATWNWHRRWGDYPDWVGTSIKDDELTAELRGNEEGATLPEEDAGLT